VPSSGLYKPLPLTCFRIVFCFPPLYSLRLLFTCTLRATRSKSFFRCSDFARRWHQLVQTLPLSRPGVRSFKNLHVESLILISSLSLVVAAMTVPTRYIQSNNSSSQLGLSGDGPPRHLLRCSTGIARCGRKLRTSTWGVCRTSYRPLSVAPMFCIAAPRAPPHSSIRLPAP
jgi:hypothetical protein